MLFKYKFLENFWCWALTQVIMNWRNFQHNFQQFETNFKNWLDKSKEQIQPHLDSRRLRISCLSPNKIEIKLPYHPQFVTENNMVEEGRLLTAATQGFRFIWQRNTPARSLNIFILNAHLDINRPIATDLIVRAELIDLQRETILADLLNHKEAVSEIKFRYLNNEDQILAEAVVKGKLVWISALSWK
jgi:hypothetical protein